MPYQIKRSKKNQIPAVTIVTIFLFIIALGCFLVAFAFAAKEVDASAGVSGIEILDNRENEEEEPEEEASQPEPEEEEEPVYPTIDITTIFDKPLPETASVSLEYLNDAAFLGDSITEGMKLHNMSEAYIVSATSMSTLGVMSKPQDTYGGKTLIEALNDVQASKIYVMLGSNEIGGSDLNVFISRYGEILDDLKENNPGALIYVQSVPPVTEAYDNSNQLLNNESILEANKMIQNLAKEKKVFFIDVHSALADTDGYLPDDASPKDGVHFGATYFQQWIDYILCHTVPEEAAQALQMVAGGGSSEAGAVDGDAVEEISDDEDNSNFVTEDDE